MNFKEREKEAIEKVFQKLRNMTKEEFEKALDEAESHPQFWALYYAMDYEGALEYKKLKEQEKKMNYPCQEAIDRKKEKDKKLDIKREREYLIKDKICPDCGEDLTTKRVQKGWGLFKNNYRQHICCNHGILGEFTLDLL